MCTVDVTPGAEASVVALLIALRDALAAAEGIDPDTITVGPVDLGA